jgi:hypothetical protein
MSTAVTELELPLGDRALGEMAWRRLEHLRRIVGDDRATLLRLVAAYRTLGSIYAAPEAELARIVGPIAAARLRWFLDAPLAASVSPEPEGGETLFQAA